MKQSANQILNICTWLVQSCGYCGTQRKYTLGLGQSYLTAVREKKKENALSLTQPETLIWYRDTHLGTLCSNAKISCPRVAQHFPGGEYIYSFHPLFQTLGRAEQRINHYCYFSASLHRGWKTGFVGIFSHY